MKTKNFLVSGIVGGIVDFLLGWLFYGILFKDFFPQPEESSSTMVMIFLGCITFGLFVAYIYTKWAQITTAATGAKAGAIIGIFMGLTHNFFNMAMNSEATGQMFAMDVGISIVMGAIIGAVIGMVNGKLGE
ncbi:hypothetical protein [uncultured Algibacter sp.]|uniref:hypothetical protein n=1 Tax=uncultured Algibacter sp. TaxID=298659 RepID=UPI00261C997C|nr:hypothetical protein [uncultured Algibacter sp.]